MGYYSQVYIAIAYIPDSAEIDDDQLKNIISLIATHDSNNIDLAIQLLHGLDIDTTQISAIRLFLTKEWEKFIIKYDDHIKIIIDSVKISNWSLFDELTNITNNLDSLDYGIITSGEEFDDVKYYGDPGLYNMWISKSIYYD